MVIGRSRRSLSCSSQPLSDAKVQQSYTASFEALNAATVQIQQLDRAMASAHKTGIDEDLLAHIVELSDTACFSVSAAEAQYYTALAEYEDSFSPLRRRLKRLGTRTKAYHAANVEPREARLKQARSVFEQASELKRKMEETVESAERASAPSEILHCPSSVSICTDFMSTVLSHHAFDFDDESNDSF